MTFLVDPTWLAAATWIGLVATIAGFWFTLVQVFKARRASEAAREASRRTADFLRTHQKLTDASDCHAEIQHARRFIFIGQAGAAEHCLKRVHRVFAELKGEHEADPKRKVLVDECIEKLETSLSTLVDGESFDYGSINTNLIFVERALGQFIGQDRARGNYDV
jgi:DNA gyrase/topoisomerase IV subunit B